MQGQNEFDQYYESVYGDRWSSLKEALKTKAKKVALLDPNGACDLDGHEFAPLLFEQEEDFPNPNTQYYSYYCIRHYDRNHQNY